MGANVAATTIYTTSTATIYPTATATETATTSAQIWPLWVATNTTASAITVTNVWPVWVAETTTGSAWDAETDDGYAFRNRLVRTIPGHVGYGAEGRHLAGRDLAPPTVEERAAMRLEAERREATRRRLAEEERERRAEAEARAYRLLDMALSQEQRRTLATLGYFYVTGSSGRRYRIEKGSHGNVYEIGPDGAWIARLCAQPLNVPAGDSMLVQMLLLQTDEEAYRNVANITHRDGHVVRGHFGLLRGDALREAA